MIAERTVTALVIGRAGSAGLPGKNSLPLAGRPMISHAIADGLAARTVDRVLVSTDGAAIGAAAAAMRVEVIDRPAELASATATVDGVVRHAFEWIGGCDVMVVLYANVPVRPAGLVDDAVRHLVETGADSVQSYCPVGKHHPHWMVRLEDDDRVHPYVETTTYRRQDLPALCIPDGGVIAVTRSAIESIRDDVPGSFLGADRRGIETTEGDVVDVDSARDFLVAEAALRLRQPGAVA